MTGELGLIYVLHLHRPFKHAKHYIGWTHSGRLWSRFDEHVSGKGTPLIRAAIEAGIGVKLAHVIPGTRDDERKLKNRNCGSGVCPICRPAWLASKKRIAA